MPARVLNLMGAIWRERGMYTAYCPELDLATCAGTVEKARQNLLEVIAIFLEETAEMGTQRELLAGSGFDLDATESEEAARQLVALIPLQVPLQTV